MKTKYGQIQGFMAKYGNEMTREELEKEAQRLYDKRIADEDRLLRLYEEKKLTNKNTIRKAKAIKARREAATKSE